MRKQTSPVSLFTSHFFNFHYLAKNEMVSSFCQVFMQDKRRLFKLIFNFFLYSIIWFLNNLINKQSQLILKIPNWLCPSPFPAGALLNKAFIVNAHIPVFYQFLTIKEINEIWLPCSLDRTSSVLQLSLDMEWNWKAEHTLSVMSAQPTE